VLVVFSTRYFVTKYLRKLNLRQEDLFWLTVSEISVSGLLAALLLDL
jgi:hypothetical protein